jgi:hypothetical protein
LILFVVRFCRALISFLRNITRVQLILSKQKICLFQILQEVIMHSWLFEPWRTSTRSTVMRLIKHSIILTCLRLIIITHWSIEISLFPIRSLWSLSSINCYCSCCLLSKITDLRFADIWISVLRGSSIEIIICSTHQIILYVFTNRRSWFHLLRGTSATCCFHIM